MKSNGLNLFTLLSILFIIASFNIYATAPPTALKIANTIASGNWNNPAIWSNGKVPADSTFVIIKSGHNVTLVANSTCESLVIEQNASLNNSTYKLTIQFMDWAHGIVHSGFDDGITYFGYAPIDNTWSITNPNNGNWNIYKVDGIHAGTGDISFSFWDYLQSTNNAYGMTISGSGTVTNTGSIYTENLNVGGQYIKFNSACNLTLYCNVKLIEDNNTMLYGGSNLNGENFGLIKLKGSADFIATNYNGNFKNYPNSNIILENGSFYANPLLSNSFPYLCYIENNGLIHVQNGNFYMPDGAVVANFDSVIVNGNILGASLISTNSSVFIQQQQNCVLAVTGEIFPATYNRGALVCALVEPNYVIYNGSGNQNILVPSDAADPYNAALTGAYSILMLANNNTKTLLGNITVDDSLIISNNAILNTGLSSYDIKMDSASVWKNTGSDANPFVENNSLVSFLGNNTHQIICTVSGGETFYDLTISNPNGVNLVSTDVNVTDTLSLLNGVVSTGTNKIHLSNSQSGSLSNFSSTSFVNGNFKRSIVSNTNTYSFPLGNAVNSTSYYRADVLNNNMTGVSFIEANINSIVETGNNVDSHITTFQNSNPITDVVNTAIWNLTPNAQPTSGNYGIKLFTQNITGLTDNMFFTVKRPLTSVDYVDWNTYSSTTTIPSFNSPGRTIASGYAERSGLASFSQFAIGIVSNLTTSLEDKNAVLNGINIYPNPASTNLNIDLSTSNSNVKTVTVVLYDILGNKITEAISTNNNIYTINRNGLVNGVYVLKVIAGENIYSKKIIFE